MLGASLWSGDHDGYLVAGMWDVPAKDPGDGTESTEGLEAISRGASIQPYTSAKDTEKGNLYSCPTAAKFGKDFYYTASSAMLTVPRDTATCYGVNSFAVMYDADNYLGILGAPCEDTTLLDWGPNRTYMLEHGKSKLLQIPQPSSKVYFTDFSYMVLYDWMYDPLNVYYLKPGANPDQSNAYGKVAKLSLVPAKGMVVQARWHGKVKDTGYGYGNIGWFDNSVSKEPQGFDDPHGSSSGGFGRTTTTFNWQDYFYSKH
jgi:hypothetical protein